MICDCPDCATADDDKPDPMGECADEVAEIIIAMRYATVSRLREAAVFHDMLRERLLAEELLH